MNLNLKSKNFIKYSISLYLFASLASCTANLMNREIYLQRSKRPLQKQYQAAISNFRFFSKNDPSIKLFRSSYIEALKKATINSIYNSSLFELVSANDVASPSNKETIFFDIQIEAEELSSFDWGITWPAVYPMSGYWPIQKKDGTTLVSINATIYKGSEKLGEIHSKVKSQFNIYFYGFYRTAAIEIAVEAAYYKALNKFSNKIRQNQNIFGIQQKKKSKIKTMAIIDFESSDLKKSELKVLTDKLRSDLISTNTFVVLESSRMADILKEQEFQQTGCTSDSCKVEIGKILGVTHLIAGEVGKFGKLYSISVRIIDVESGVILKHINSQYKGSMEILITKGISDLVKKLQTF